MANPIPCGICQQVADAEFLVTDRTPDFQILGVPTTGMCVQCFVVKGLEIAQALQTALEQVQAEGETPGVLEAVEADEGVQGVADPLPPAPKSRKAKEAQAETAVAAEETADAVQ